jgi:hypothetical protein
MNISPRWSRAGGALAAVAATLSLASAQAAVAAPARTTTLTDYSDATFLQHALGFPASDTAPAIEPVTYDRFQWLLQQPGRFAVLIGDPATDATFAARARDIEAAAQTAGVKKVYWFDPNLSGNAQVGSITEPNLDIRDPAGITLAAASQTKYDNAWKSLIGNYLGNGLNVAQSGLNSESATVTVTTDATRVNDHGGTKLGAGGAGGILYDYSGGTPAHVQDSYFLIYDKDGVNGADPAKIVGWTDLTADDSAATTQAVSTALTVAGGASQLAEADQFAFWKDEVNAKNATQSSATGGASHTILSEADNADGWRIRQVPYPEIVDLLKSGAGSADAAILFGGTWCPNTRPVLPSINKDAQENGVREVYNFDTVLDGGVVGGSTTATSDPLQTRNKSANGSTLNANPSSLYGDLVSQYLTNINTEYGPIAEYYPGGDTSGTLQTIKKLQVPFLLGYHSNGGATPNAGVTRQWIIDLGAGAFREYMTNWGVANPQPNELNLSATQLPPAAPIWTKINQAISTFTWQTDSTPYLPNTASDANDDQYLVAADTATVSNPGGPTVTTSASGPVDISPATLASTATALGSSLPANLAAAKTALIAATNASSPDATLVSRLTTVVGAWGVAQTRKNKVLGAIGDPVTPGSLSGGLNALHQVDVFFGGLPGGVLSHRTVTADAVTAGTAPKISIKIDNDYGRTPAGNVALTVKQGSATVATQSAAVAGGTASFTLPALGAGSYDYTLSYAGDDQLAAFTESGTLTVNPAPKSGGGTTTTTTTTTTTAPGRTPVIVTPTRDAKIRVSKVKGSLVKVPTSRKGGKYTVSITVAKGKTAAGGKITLKLRKGKTTKTVTARLSKGKATFTLPKLAKGTWKVTISWPGDTRYRTVSVTGASIKVIK